MATAAELALLVRSDKEINDTEKAKYSDYELLLAINSILRTMNNVLCTALSDIVEKTVTVTLTNGVADMPTDWVETIQVYASIEEPLIYFPPPAKLIEGFYRISGSQIFAPYDAITVIYKRSFPRLLNLSENLPLPDIFLDMLADYVKMILKGTQPKTNDIILALDSTNIKSIMARRKITGIETPMPYIT